MADPLEGPPITVPMFDDEQESGRFIPWTKKLTGKWQRWYSSVTAAVIKLATRTQYGAGSPENVVTASVGTLYLRSDGGANTTLYVKESGNAKTGWVAK